MKSQNSQCFSGRLNTTEGQGAPLYKWRPCMPFNITFEDKIAEEQSTCQNAYVSYGTSLYASSLRMYII